MKIHAPHLLSAALAMLTVSALQAQVAEIVILEKLAQYTQTSAGAPTLQSNPYRFDLSVSNTDDANLSGITAPTLTLAAGSGAPGGNPTAHNGGTLVYNTDGNEWRYGAPDGYGYNLNTIPNLNAYFANGVYSFTVEGNTYSLDNRGAGSDAFFPGFIPTLTLSGGSWIGGKYVIDVNQELEISTNVFTAYSSTGVGAMVELGLDDVEEARSLSRIAPDALASSINESANSATFIVPAGTLTAGMDYEGSSTFARFVAQDTSVAGMFVIAWWANETSFTVSAIPEPSTYAMFAGLGALGLAVWRRRRQTA